jgi:uncharacterized protein YodC (DUF2158 family)
VKDWSEIEERCLWFSPMGTVNSSFKPTFLMH